ncbi:MAG: hypothetical protein JWL77_2730 [Chthonomonadaceae bacterium]|nr:hypothetical protein [Chthonomonadaceae bacterium]
MRHFRLSSGRMLSLLGASILCCSSAGNALAGHQNTAKPPSKPGSALKQITLFTRKGKASPPTQEAKPKTQIGDLTISGATKTEGDTTGAAHLTGPDTEVEIPDKASKSVLFVHADDIRVSRVGKSPYGLITLDRNVRYRLVQKTDSGERSLEGTAGHAEVRRTTKRLELTGGVRAKLTDAARFKGTASLRTGSLQVETDAQPNRFHLDGAAANNDIQFTPLQSPPPKTDGKPAAPTPLGTIHIYGFRSGDLQFGEAIHLQGASTACEFASPDEKTSWRLQGEQFEGEFVPKTSDLQRATVTDNVRFHLTQPAADKKLQTTVDGTASRASYVRSEAGQETLVHGPLHIGFIDPLHLDGPGIVTAEKSATLALKKSGGSFTYSLDDPLHTGKMQFTLKPFEEATSKPATPTVPK